MPLKALRRNFSSVVEVVLASHRTTSVAVKVLTLTCVASYFISYSDLAIPYVAVVPGYVLPPNLRLWTLVTHSCLQAHIWLTFVDILVILFSAKLLAPLWGETECILFYVVVVAVSASLGTIVCLCAYYVTGYTEYLFETRIHGLPAFIGGFCVAVKQVMPDQPLWVFPCGKLRNKHIPLCVFVLSIPLTVGGLLDGPYPMMLGFGILTSWTYLRFYQKHETGTRGDMAQSFSFASFFPDIVEGPIDRAGTAVFRCLVALKMCQIPKRRYDMASPDGITVAVPSVGSAQPLPPAADRRRQLAIKALNERLDQMKEEESVNQQLPAASAELLRSAQLLSLPPLATSTHLGHRGDGATAADDSTVVDMNAVTVAANPMQT